MNTEIVEVVIKIPETLKTNIDNGHFWGSATIFEAIQRGTIIPKGEWKPCIDKDGTPTLEEYYGRVYECSVCHFRDLKSEFCPNCGARMYDEADRGDKNG